MPAQLIAPMLHLPQLFTQILLQPQPQQVLLSQPSHSLATNHALLDIIAQMEHTQSNAPLVHGAPLAHLGPRSAQQIHLAQLLAHLPMYAQHAPRTHLVFLVHLPVLHHALWVHIVLHIT